MYSLKFSSQVSISQGMSIDTGIVAPVAPFPPFPPVVAARADFKASKTCVASGTMWRCQPLRHIGRATAQKVREAL